MMDEQVTLLDQNQSSWRSLDKKWKFAVIGLSIFSLILFICLIAVSVVAAKNGNHSNSPTPTGICSESAQLQEFTSVSSGLYRANRNQLLTMFQRNDGILFFQGNVRTNRNADTELLFRQDSDFLYVSGVDYPGCYFLIDLNTTLSFLIVPDRSSYDAVWFGREETPQELMAKFDVDGVYYISQMANLTQSINPTWVYTKQFINDPSINSFPQNTSYLPRMLMRSRLVKTNQEISVLRLVSQISSRAHEAVMKASQPSLFEFHLESLFLYETYNCYLRHQAYVPIVASGYNSAVLHYNTNDRQMQNGDLLLVDAAGEFNGYASDVSRTFPVNGIFTNQQKVIYQAVLNVQETLIQMLAPGVTWSSLSSKTRTLVCQELIQAGIITTTLENALFLNLSTTFLPHGLGHFVGLDVHDGNTPTTLQAGNVLTIEPGIYFNEALLEAAFANPLKAPALNAQLIESYRNFGGVRIEDVILITPTGYEVLSNAVKSVEDIQNLMHNK